MGGLIIAIALFALAALVFFDATTYPERRNYGNFGPAIFPFIVASGIVLMALLTLALAWRGDFPTRQEMNLPPVLWVAGAVAAEIVILTAGLGFTLGSGVLFGFAARGLGRRPLWLTVCVGIVVSLLLYILFRHGLGLSLPAGPVERVVNGLMS